MGNRQYKFPKRERILKNRAKCLLCGDIIESKGRHDFVTCSCGSLSVDGGRWYLSRCYNDRLDWEERSLIQVDNNHAIFGEGIVKEESDGSNSVGRQDGIGEDDAEE